jgi:hypothetical protein
MQGACVAFSDVSCRIFPQSFYRSLILTPWSRILLEKLTGLQLVKKFPASYGTRRFITAFTSARHLSLSWASSIQSIPPHHTSWRSNLILSSHLRLGLPSGLFPSGFPTKTLNTPLPSPIRATRPAHHILLEFITRTTEKHYEEKISECLHSKIFGPHQRRVSWYVRRRKPSMKGDKRKFSNRW